MDRNEGKTTDGGTIRREEPTAGEEMGQAVGGVSGVVAGAAIGSAAGPIGTVIGGLAGAVGGWWAGKAVVDAAQSFDDSTDNNYRQAYEARDDRLADRSYDDIRPAYQLGHLASENPDYSGRNFETIEADLQRGWTNDLRARHGDWSTVRPFAEEAFTSRSSVASREATNRLHNSGENLADRASDTTRNIANSAIGAVDNVKDRIDGNPASKPGLDPTDKRL